MSNQQDPRSLDPRAQAAEEAKVEQQEAYQRAADVKAYVADGAKKAGEYLKDFSQSDHPVSNAMPGLVDRAHEHVSDIAQNMEHGYAQTSDEKVTADRTTSRAQPDVQLGHPGSSPLPDKRKVRQNLTYE
jgi:hypothetical protein